MRRLLLIVPLVLLIAACGPIYETHYSYQAPKSVQGKQCIISCQQAKTTCSSACSMRYNQCQTQAQRQARFRYAEYRSRQRLRHQPIKRDLSSFYNPSGCYDSCGCNVKFNDCYTMCGGKVLIHKRCVAFCGRQ